MITRRNFFSKTAQWIGLSSLIPVLSTCEAPKVFRGKIAGQNFSLGHRLHKMDFGPVTSEEKIDVVIVGGGVAGLSAARYLKKHTNNFTVLEMAEQPGGNSLGGKNELTAFPWGAHYLPLPAKGDPELINFLEEAGVITGYQEGKPVFNDYYLCFDPKERLYIHNHWQEGIVPHAGVPEKDRDEIEHFLSMMHDFKELRGSDGLEAFTVPVALSSQDKKLLALDSITAAQFLTDHHFTSPYLKWYVNYCCADDYGSSINDTSAWAAIHYFASRKGVAHNSSSDTVLTWPEGNFWLINKLKSNFQEHIRPNALVYKITCNPHDVEVLYYDPVKQTSAKITCSKVIMATPQFINARLLHGVTRSIDHRLFHYAPWMVANISLTGDMLEKRGEPLCWDNVIYGSDSMGYINAMHQHTTAYQTENVVTYYKPLLGATDSVLRKEALEKKFEDWKKIILTDLEKPHPGIEKQIHEMNVWVWGHGMIKPEPGMIWSENLKTARAPLNNKIFFAHSDLSGISIFEEAFYHGHRAAKEILSHG